jgi:phenylalanine-4-hydroxylase
MFVHDGIGFTPMKVEPVSSEFEQSLGEHGNEKDTAFNCKACTRAL